LTISWFLIKPKGCKVMEKKDPSLTPPNIISAPTESRYADDGRCWQGIPSVEKTKAGQLYVVFYSGMKTEDSGNFVVVMRSRDGGEKWLCPWMIIEHPRPDIRCFDPNIWLDPTGRLWIFWSQSRGKFDGRAGVWAITTRDPDAEQPTWSKPRRFAHGVMMNKPTVLRDGTWLFPCAVWISHPAGEQHPEVEHERFSNVYASTDQGKTINWRGGADLPDRSFDEHAVIERSDGSLWMLIRAKDGIGESHSTDGGYSWSRGVSSSLSGPSSRFFIGHLASGRLLMINHIHFSGRNNLAAMLSEDDGQTWPYSLLLDERDAVSYPDATEDENGLITVVYDRERYAAREILMATLTEQDIRSGTCVTEACQMKMIINQATG
jgi:hypothetical protein